MKDIDYEIYEPDDDVVTCSWCGEDCLISDCKLEKDLGYVCDHCQQAIESRGEKLDFVEGKKPYSSKKYTTGDIQKNIDHFNGESGDSMGEELEEAKKKKDCSSVTYTTGDPQKNVDHFNKMLVGKAKNTHMDGLPGAWANKEADAAAKSVGTFASQSPDGASSISTGGGEGGGMGESLNLDEENLEEAKRYVRRYYIKPQEIFCSNKADIIKALIDIDDNDCTVYTLNNLGDIKDVNKLTDKDIIYTYKDGILFDKNGVKVMDYDLYIKHEENRDEINPNQVSDAKFNDVYDDRMTDQTVVETLTESQSQEIARTYEILSDRYGVDMEDLVYGTDGFMNTCYPDGFPDFSGDIIYTEKYWDEFEEWLRDVKGIELDHSNDPVGTETKMHESYDFSDILTEAYQESDYCCICGELLPEHPNIAEPYKEGQCCDACNEKFVIPARLEQMHERTNK